MNLSNVHSSSKISIGVVVAGDMYIGCNCQFNGAIVLNLAPF
jgi:hypothetical protein